MLKIYDGNNQFQLRLASDPTGLPVRGLLKEAQEATDPTVWVFDGVNGNKRRRALYPNYKVQRKPPAENIFESMRLFEKLLKYTKAIKIKVPEYEADDVIATLAKLYADKLPVHIYSNDSDLLPLTEHPNITQERHPFDGCERRHIRLYKATVGDPKDNIKGIPLFGRKAFETCDKEWLLKFFENDVDCVEYLNVKPKQAEWIKENANELRRMYQIVGLIDVPMNLIEENTIVGVSNPSVIAEALRGIFV